MRLGILLLIATAAHAVTSTGTGNWASVMPGWADGATAVIADGHTVTIPAGATVTAGDDSATAAIACATDSGTGILIVNGTLILHGTVRQCAAWVIGPGATITHASTVSSFKWRQMNGSVLHINGLSYRRVTINKAGGALNGGGFGDASSGTWGQVIGSYFDVSDWDAPFSASLNTVNSIFSLDHCTITRPTGTMAFYQMHASAVWSIDHCAILDPPTPATLLMDIFQLGNIGPLGYGGVRQFTNNYVNDGQIKLSGGVGVDIGMRFQNNVLAVKNSAAYASLAPSSQTPNFTGTEWSDNIFWQDRATGGNSNAMNLPTGTLNRTAVVSSDRACVADKATFSGQVDNNLTIFSQPLNTTIDGWVIDMRCGYGVAFIDNTRDAAAPWTLEVKNSIVIPDPDGLGTALVDLGASSSYCLQTGSSYCATGNVHHNTFVGNREPQVAGLATNHDASTGPYTGMYSNVSDNLVWQPTSTTGTVIAWVGPDGGHPLQAGAYANVTNNWTWNISPVSGAYQSYGASAYSTFALGSSGDPQFIDRTRNILTFFASKESSDTTLDLGFAHFAAVARPEKWDRRYTPSFIIDYLRSGFVPQNAAVATAGHDGGYVGAINTARQTWYVRTDGGDRQRCDGLHDAADPGSGTNQPCAFSNPYWLWTDNAASGAGYVAISDARRGPDGVAYITTSAPHGFSDGQDVLVYPADLSFANQDWHNHAYRPVPVHVTDTTHFSYQQDRLKTIATSSGGTGARSFASWRWIINSGDTVVIKNGSYRMGQGGSVSWNLETAMGGWGRDAYMPPPPSGVEGIPTRIVGEGYATGCASKPELFGAKGAKYVFYLFDSHYVDLECLEITDHAMCKWPGITGSPLVPDCNYSEDVAAAGINTRKADHFSLKNLFIHGLAVSGIQGGQIDGGTVDHVQIMGMPGIGWNWDDGNAGFDWYNAQLNHECVAGHYDSCSVNRGDFEIDYLTLMFSGCQETYPYVNDKSYNYCTHYYDSDGFGFPISAANLHFNHADFRHNMSDNLDMVYNGACLDRNYFLANGDWDDVTARAKCALQQPGGNWDNKPTVLIENSHFEDAGKGLAKSSGFNVTIRNNELLENCKYWMPAAAGMGYGADIATDIWDASGLVHAYCGAATITGWYESTATNHYIKSYGTLTIQNNTIMTSNDGIIYGCGYEDNFFANCSNSDTTTTAHIDNNLLIGDPAGDYFNGGGTQGICAQNAMSMLQNASSTRHNNLYTTTPACVYGGVPPDINLSTYHASGEKIVAAGVVSANFVTPDVHLSAGSGAIDAGATLTGFATDYAGNTRPAGAAWDIGAYEYNGVAVCSISPTTAGPYTAGQTVSTTFTQSNCPASSWSATGLTGSGLSLNASTGALAGTAVAGTYSVTISYDTAGVTFTLTVTGGVPPPSTGTFTGVSTGIIR